MWSFLLLLALSVKASVLALTLSGPTAIFACEASVFSWNDGTPPYAFHPLVGTSNTSIVTLTTPISWYNSGSPGSVYQFYVVDSVGDISNVLSYNVQDSGSCAAASTVLSSVSFSIGGTTTQISSGGGPIAIVSTRTATAAPTLTEVTTQSSVVSVETSRILYPTASATVEPDTAMTLRLSLSMILTIVATVGGALLIICLCCWGCCKARRARKVQRRSQPRQLMKNANLNGSGLLLTDPSSSRQYGLVPSTPNSGDATMPLAPLATHVLPSSKERRMRGAVYREADLEDGLSISEISGPMSTAHSTSIWPASTIAFPEHSPSRAQFQEPALQSLQAIIGREIQEMLHGSESRTSPTRFANTPSPLSSLNDLPSSHASANDLATLKPPIVGKPTLSLEIPQTNRDPRSILQSATTPISRRDMEVLADLVAQRLISGRVVESPARDQNSEAPPPRYS